MSAIIWRSIPHPPGDKQDDISNELPGHPKNKVDQPLAQLVAEICRYPRDSFNRRQGFNHLIQAILKSGKLWREDTAYYEEALQQTWLYLYRNLCQANTGEQYDPSKSSVTTWLNRYLKKRLLDCRIEEQQQQRQRVFQRPSGDNETPDPITNLAAAPDIPPILEESKHWIETDPDGELRRVHIKGRPDLTCQVLLLRRLPPETGWETLAAEFNCPLATLANFYQRQCFPRLRKFGQMQGYL